MIDWRSSWQRAWHGVGASGDGGALFHALLDRYAEPHRKYHTQQHLGECLSAFESVIGLPPHPAEVEVALWFHDAIYDVKRSDNEERSADWAHTALLSGGARAEGAALVRTLVLATRHAAEPAMLDEQVLVDIDLAILGAPEARFLEYERQIREEYDSVPGWLFKRKRRAILRSFLKRPRIFSTPHFNALLEERARANLAQVVAA
jgi:predicted metal-dependent HD superfamily phosphohydrolase